jgi:hypothetical protein
MEVDHYEEVPGQDAEKIIAKAVRKEKEKREIKGHKGTVLLCSQKEHRRTVPLCRANGGLSCFQQWLAAGPINNIFLRQIVSALLIILLFIFMRKIFANFFLN